MTKNVFSLCGMMFLFLTACTNPETPPDENGQLGSPSLVKPIQGENTGTDKTPAFRWTGVSGAISYQLQADDDADFSSIEYEWTDLEGTNYSPLSDMDVSATPPVGTRYYIRVRAIGSGGDEGPWSNEGALRYVNVGRFDNDFNGDGYSDLLVGSQNGAAGGAGIYYGGTSMDDEFDLVLNNYIADLYNFGHCVSAGDINGDGYADAIVGCFPQGALMHVPWVCVYYGSEEMDGDPDWSWVCVTSEKYFGASVAALGDVNADGFDDVAIGSFGYQSGTGWTGIYLGSSSPDSDPDIVLAGQDQLNYFGYSVASAGDVNADGYMDILVGAYYYNSRQGRAYIYLGGDAVSTTPALTLTGESSGDQFALSVSSAGDLDDDGYSDVIIGACAYSSSQGKAYFFLGGSQMDDECDFSVAGGESSGYFGFSCAGAGDINGDSHDDSVIGAYTVNSNQGRAYLLLGNDDVIDSTDHTYSGENTGDRFGYCVSGIGDVNADGYPDYAVGASNYNGGQGAVYVYLGGASISESADTILTTTGTTASGCSIAPKF